MSSSVYVDNKKGHFNSWKRSNTKIVAYTDCRKLNTINFTVTKKKFCLSLHYNRANSYSFVNGTKIIKLKSKYSEIIATPLYLRNIPKDWSVDYMKRTGFNGYVYDISVDYDAAAVDDIFNIHKYLKEKNHMI